MLDFARITGFEWDDGNGRKSSDKHAVSQAEAEQVFTDARLIVAPDDKHSMAEPRFHALGTTSTGRLLHLTFTVRDDGTRIRVISARAASRRERAIYEAKD